MNKRLRIFISLVYIFLLGIILALIELETILRFTPLIILFSFLIFSYSFGLEETKQTFIVLFFIIIILFISYLWLFNKKFLGLEFNSESIIALFTIVLAAATISNCYIYMKSIHMSRIPILNIELNKKTLVLIVENVSNFPARNISVEIDVIDKDADIIMTPKNMVKVYKKIFNPFSQIISYIPPWDKVYKNKIFDCRNFLCDKLGVKLIEKGDGGKYPAPVNEKVKKSFLIKVKTEYYTDTMHKVPFISYLNYNVTIQDGKVEISEEQ